MPLGVNLLSIWLCLCVRAKENIWSYAQKDLEDKIKEVVKTSWQIVSIKICFLSRVMKNCIEDTIRLNSMLPELLLFSQKRYRKIPDCGWKILLGFQRVANCPTHASVLNCLTWHLLFLSCLCGLCSQPLTVPQGHQWQRWINFMRLEALLG